MRPSIAVIVPQHRAWVWHQRLISTLQKTFDVDVYTSASAPRYPLSLRLWTRLEVTLLGQLDLVKIVTIVAEPWPDVVNTDYAVIMNLSEAPIQNTSIPILEPQFDGCTDSARLFQTLFNRKNPYLSIHLAGQKEPSVASYLAIQDRRVLIRGLQFSFARLQALAERAVDYLIRDLHTVIAPRPANATHLISTALISFILLFFLDKLFGRYIRRFQIAEHWVTGILWSDHWEIPHGVPLQKFVIIPDDRQRFYADPFPFSNEGKSWLFVEEFQYNGGKGVISCMPVAIGERAASPEPALIRPYHLSHPFVFRHGDAIYMLPETGGNRTVELYRARSFPFDWVLHQVLMKDIELYDATLLWHADRWWIFGTIGHHSGSHHDELAIFHSEHLEGPWKPHRLNPVKSDCRSARPAGRIVMRDGRLLRPAQDCEYGYGSAIIWLEIEELTTDSFKERELARWSGSAELDAEGLHTFNYDQGLGAIDKWRTTWSLLGQRSAATAWSWWNVRSREQI